MGCAPSAELLGVAPFRPPQGGIRQVALIPVVKQFFPSPDCALFKQLYEAYTDPSVRYYVRPNFDGPNGDLSRIPDVVSSREELHRALLQLTGQGMFRTNADVWAAYAAGDVYRIRPILCAVVFLYEGANYVPEGSVQLTTHGRGPSVFVKVIGMVGDTTMILQRADDPATAVQSRNTLKMQTLITKSAGDHNMLHVVLLASYIYYHQCCAVIGLPRVPPMSVHFTCFKTNIPFLCFLREMRDRMAGIRECPKDSKCYIDEYCLHGTATQEYVDTMMPALAHYFVSFLNAKTEQRMVRQLAHQRRASGMHNGALQDGKSASLVVIPIGSGQTQGGGHRNTSTQPGAEVHGLDGVDHTQIAQVAAFAAKADAAVDPSNSAAPKVTYVVKGYLTRPVTSLSAYSCAPNEVYVTCMDGSVVVVDRRSVDAPDGPTHTPSLGQEDGVEEIEEERGAPASARTVMETFTVRRGDILSFYTTMSSLAEDEAAVYAEKWESFRSDDSGESESMTSLPTNFLRLNTDDDSVVLSPSMSSLVKREKGTPTLRRGSWRIDDSIYIESVLLSLVRDECKLAREASVDDPRWVHDDIHNCPVHDGSFYVWHFRRGQENFFYGTVPKFANTNRAQKRSDAASCTRALRNSGIRVSKNGMIMVQNSGNHNKTHPNANVGKKFDNGSNNHNSNTGSGRQLNGSADVLLQQHIGATIPYPANGSLAHLMGVQPQPPQQQQQCPSYIASGASASANTYLQFGNTVPGSGLVFGFPSGDVATTTPPMGPFMYGMPYAFPGSSPPFSVPPQGQQGMFLPASVMVPPHQEQQGKAWVPVKGPGASPTSHGMGDSRGTANFSMTNNESASAAASAPTVVPYIMNAQGQLVPLSNVMTDSSHASVARAATSTPQALTTPQVPSYVMVNGRLCVLQPAAAATPSSPPQLMSPIVFLSQ